MILKLVGIALFWRRNNLPSIVFKSLFWGALAWLAVGIFTSFQTALIAGLAASGLAAVKYTLKNIKRRKKLLSKVGGDKEKLKQMEALTKSKGLGGALMSEMLSAELDMDDDDDDYEEEEPLSQAQQAELTVAIQSRCQQISNALLVGGFASEEHCKEATENIMEENTEARELPEPIEYLQEFLPDSVIHFCLEDFCNEDEHAELVSEFANSTNGKWSAGEARSTFDEATNKWLVSFDENGERKTWRFSQNGDHLNTKFLEQLMQYTQRKSGYVVEVVCAEDDFVQISSLSPEIHNMIFDIAEQQAA